MLVEEKETISQKFNRYQIKRIVVYGTGVVAKKVITALENYNIVGVVDRIKCFGFFCEKPLLMWDEVSKENADIIIIAASKKNQETIYRRIQDKCLCQGLLILGAEAENLSIYYGNDIERFKIYNYCKKNIEELKEEIRLHDAISFDIFDTIIMRKVLEPTDIFDLVEYRLNKKGHKISGFKKARIEADLRSKGGTIYDIYAILQSMLSLDDNSTSLILEEELACEKESLVVRKDMIDVMEYAFGLGKTVSLISDMYLPQKLMTDILSEMGIVSYHKLYISCEYKTAKTGTLFDIYKKDIKKRKCLHIGDDCVADLEMPSRYGIDAYQIYSSLEMLRLSEMHIVLGYLSNTNEKNLIGLLIAELFNSPFALQGTFGNIKIDELSLMGKVFLAPLVTKYVLELVNYLEMHTDYEGVLFAARDGFLYQKLYEKYRSYFCGNKSLPQSYYFLTSRKVGLRVATFDYSMMEVIKTYLSTTRPEDILQNILGIEELYDQKEKETDEDYIERHLDKIISKSRVTRKNYKMYLEQTGIANDKKYLFCEQDSQGTTQNALNRLFEVPLDGFYLSRYYTKQKYDLPIIAIYEAGKYVSKANAILLSASFLETVMSAPHPPIMDIDANGKPIYDREERTLNGIEAMIEVQKGIETFFECYLSIMIENLMISDEIPEVCYRLFLNAIYSKKCLRLEDAAMEDNLLGGRYNIWTNAKE